jgi:Arc/MetJ-type ribon-helix-helix transcriptional regulator
LKIRTITVRLPDEATKWLDSLVKSGIYKSRSEAIREFAREYLSKTVSEEAGR